MTKEAIKVGFKLPGLCSLSVVIERGTPLPSASLPNHLADDHMRRKGRLAATVPQSGAREVGIRQVLPSIRRTIRRNWRLPRDIRKGCILIGPEYAVKVSYLHVIFVESKISLPPFSYAVGKPDNPISLRWQMFLEGGRRCEKSTNGRCSISSHPPPPPNRTRTFVIT